MAPEGTKTAADDLPQLEALLRQDPRSPEFFRLADAYTRAGRFVEAAAVCKQGLRFHPQLSEGYVALGRALFGAGHLPKAVQVLRKCLTFKNPGVESYRLLGEVLLWQDAPSEAVAILEEAIARGLEERTIRALLERARGVLDSQNTEVVQLPEHRRGIGNVAIAGTIGSGELPGPEALEGRFDDIEKTPRLELLDPGLRLPRASPPPLERSATGERWASLEDMWSRELDAHTQPFPDVESDPGASHLPRSKKVDVKLAPLVSPLAGSMPPLPTEDSGPLRLPMSGAADDLTPPPEHDPPPRAPRVSPPVPAAAALSPLPAEIPAAPPRQPPPLLVPASSEATVRWSTPARAAPPSPEPVPAAPRGSADPDPTPPPEPAPRPGGSAPEVGLAFLPTGASPPISGPEPDLDQNQQLLEALAASSTGRARRPRGAIGSAPQQARRRGNGTLFWVIVCTACALVGAGGVFLYLHFFSGKASRSALDRAARARLQDAPAEYQACAEQLQELARHGEQADTLSAEAELMRGLAWLQYRAGEAPRPGAGKTWPHALAQAAVALANNDPRRAEEILEGEPREEANQGLRLLLLAWASWLEGEAAEAEQQLAAARQRLPELTAAEVLEGFWRWEARDLPGAERAFRRALVRSPQHEVAAAGLTAVVLARDPRQAELDPLLARSYTTHVGKTWQRLLQVERQLLLGDRSSLSALPEILGAAPAAPSLIYHGLEVLLRSGRFLECGAELQRLKKIRAETDPALLLLESELDLAQGLELRAAERLARLESQPARRLRAWALALAGRASEIHQLIADDPDPSTRPLRLLLPALADQAQPDQPLRELAESSDQGRLALLLLLQARGNRAEAMKVARQLQASPSLVSRALLAQASLHFLEARQEAALDVLLSLQQLSPGYPPAEELLGQLNVQLGDPAAALVRLRAARAAGRATPGLAEAWVKALALTGQLAEAASELEKARSQLDQTRQQALADYLLIAAGRPVSPGSPAASELPFLLGLGEVLLKAGRINEAEKVWRRARALFPDHPLPYLKLGNLQAGRRRPDAVAYFDKAIERARKQRHFPSSFLSEAHLARARHHLVRNEQVLAVEQARQVIKLGVHAAAGYRLLAEAFLGSRRHREAREALRALVLLEPTDADAYFLLGSAVKADRPAIQHALGRFLELEPTGKRALQARRLLKRGR